MGRLIYGLNLTLDGFVETPSHGLDWSTVDDELHQWFNDRYRTVEASLYGRRLYELMSEYWPTAGSDPNATDTEREFSAIWLNTPKIVFSSKLDVVDWNSRLARGPVEEEYQRLRAEYSGDMEVGGATLAASFIRAGLVDMYQLIIHPVILGSGTRFFPEQESPVPLRLTESHTFSSGVVYLGYSRAD